MAPAFMTTSENPILGTDHTSRTFKVCLYKFFTAKIALYRDRDMKRFGSQLTDIAREIQNFNAFLLKIEGMKPTGTQYNQILIEIAQHLDRFDLKLSHPKFRDLCNSKDLYASAWRYVEACCVLQHYPEFNVTTGLS